MVRLEGLGGVPVLVGDGLERMALVGLLAKLLIYVGTATIFEMERDLASLEGSASQGVPAGLYITSFGLFLAHQDEFLLHYYYTSKCWINTTQNRNEKLAPAPTPLPHAIPFVPAAFIYPCHYC